MKAIYKLRTLLILLVSAYFLPSAQSQCFKKVTAITGTQVVGGVEVTVTSNGFTGTSLYCSPLTGPYHVGYDWDSSDCADGSFTFEFSPSITALTLNISGITDSLGSVEEVLILINGQHYPLLSEGVINSCEPLAVLTPEGNIKACLGCGWSGWSETTITGSISSLTVKDSVIMNCPDGAVFSLFICDSISSVGHEINQYHVRIFPNPSSQQLILDNIPAEGLHVSLINSLGQEMPLVYSKAADKLILNTGIYPKGVYHLRIMHLGTVESRTVIFN